MVYLMNNTTAADLAEMMKNFNLIAEAAKKSFPNATHEELFKIISDAMNKSIGL